MISPRSSAKRRELARNRRASSGRSSYVASVASAISVIARSSGPVPGSTRTDSHRTIPSGHGSEDRRARGSSASSRMIAARRRSPARTARSSATSSAAASSLIGAALEREALRALPGPGRRGPASRASQRPRAPPVRQSAWRPDDPGSPRKQTPARGGGGDGDVRCDIVLRRKRVGEFLEADVGFYWAARQPRANSTAPTVGPSARAGPGRPQINRSSQQIDCGRDLACLVRGHPRRAQEAGGPRSASRALVLPWIPSSRRYLGRPVPGDSRGSRHTPAPVPARDSSQSAKSPWRSARSALESPGVGRIPHEQMPEAERLVAREIVASGPTGSGRMSSRRTRVAR